MARKKTRNRGQRDSKIIATQKVLGKKEHSYLNISEYLAGLKSLTEVEDRRTFNPRKNIRDSLTILGRPHQLVIKKAYPIKKAYLTAKIGFQQPEKMVICIRRKIRKKMMHIFNIAGKTGFKKKRLNNYSKTEC